MNEIIVEDIECKSKRFAKQIEMENLNETKKKDEIVIHSFKRYKKSNN